MTQKPWKTELVKGSPIKVGQREIIPIARLRSLIRRQVTFGTSASRGSGGGLLWMQPVAVIERHPDGIEKRIPIPDVTGMAMRGMGIAALAAPIIFLLISTLAFLWRKSR